MDTVPINSTIRLEYIKSGKETRPYYYAYYKQNGRLNKIYLGKTLDRVPRILKAKMIMKNKKIPYNTHTDIITYLMSSMRDKKLNYCDEDLLDKYLDSELSTFM